MKLTRRAALKTLLGGAAIIATPGGILLAKAEPVRRYWQVGANLSKEGTPVYVGGVHQGYALDGGGLTPIEGQPGLFRDNSSGNIVNIRNFSESDRYDTVTIPNRSNPDLLHDFQREAQRDFRDLVGAGKKVNPKHFVHDEFTVEGLPEGIHEDMTLDEAARVAVDQGHELHVGLVKKGWVLGA